jgi:lysophospholipase L1-like esterase
LIHASNKKSLKYERVSMEKKRIKIAALGDSMTESYGETFNELLEILGNTYTDRDFEFYNFGVGGTRAGYGLWRLTNEYEYKSKKQASLLSIEPDIVLIESFAYNNASDGVYDDDGLKHFCEIHERIVRTIREQSSAKIIFVATIAPDTDHFLEGNMNFIYTPNSILSKMAEDRIKYLEKALRIAEKLDLPIANVYQASLEKENKGTPRSTFIGDGIHPNSMGNKLAAETIAKTINEYKIISE